MTTDATNRSEGLIRVARVGQLPESTLMHNQWGDLPISEEASNAGGYTPSRCEPITVPLCKGVFYEYTQMPNMFNHETQEEAGLEVNCSPHVPHCLLSSHSFSSFLLIIVLLSEALMPAFPYIFLPN
ncbi:unnamed protein product [Dibothriocephalus latus]|uniref:FZ domain-containing protein n=1 Tax=Dibothriocephalus latus TaxID=60516 RepID=A0A3P7QSL6_DIBLA|nr:unnamed protein product [Dibothriocephalus latus]